jgi:hypothetical protein
MGTKYKEVGGGPATGLANDFIGFLQGGLNTGSFGGGSATQRTQGANPVGQTQGIAGILNDILSGGAGQLGGSMQDLISRDTNRQADALRARFGLGGGTAFGTPAAYAESNLRAEQAPNLVNAIGGLQLGAIGQILPLIAGLAGRGISQRETVASPSPWASAAAIGAPIIGAGLGALAGNPMAGASLGQGIGQAFGGGLQTPFMSGNQGLQFPNMGMGGQQPLSPLWNNYKLGY